MRKLVVTVMIVFCWGALAQATALDDVRGDLDVSRKGLENFYKQDFESALQMWDKADFNRLRSRDYLFFYKGKASLALAQKRSGDEKRKLLEESYQSFLQAYRLNTLKNFRKLIDQTLLDSLKALSREDLDSGSGFRALRRLESFRRQVPRGWNASLEQLYLEGLLLTGQKTRGRGLVLDKQSLLLPRLKKAFGGVTQQLAAKNPLRQPRSSQQKLQAFPGDRSSLIAQFKDVIERLDREPFPPKPKALGRLIGQSFHWASQRPKEKKAAVFLQLFNKHRFKLPPSVLVHIVDPIWDEGHFQEARDLARYVLKSYPASPSYEKMIYKEGRLSQDLNDHKGAISAFDRYLTSAPAGVLFEEALFQKAFSLFQLKSPKASEAFRAYIGRYPKGNHATGGRYFLIESLREQNQSGVEAAEDDLLNRYPLSYYSFLVRIRRGLEQPWDPNLFKGPDPHFNQQLGTYPMPLEAQLTFLKVDELEALGLLREAGAELSQLAYRSDRPHLMYAIGHRFKQETLAHVGLNYLTRLMYVDPVWHPILDIKAIFPKVYSGDIEAAIAKTTSPIPLHLILAQSRQESGLNPLAVSRVGAQGLMQLMPATARASAKRLKDPSLTQKMNDPESNMLLGVEVLTRLLKRYDQRIDYALAAYNAGPRAVDRWIKARGHLPPLEFAEAIPYKETRIYVLAIYRNWVIYDYVYGDAKGKGLLKPHHLVL